MVVWDLLGEEPTPCMDAMLHKYSENAKPRKALVSII